MARELGDRRYYCSPGALSDFGKLGSIELIDMQILRVYDTRYDLAGACSVSKTRGSVVSPLVNVLPEVHQR
jgi:hypothetical protein